MADVSGVVEDAPQGCLAPFAVAVKRGIRTCSRLAYSGLVVASVAVHWRLA